MGSDHDQTVAQLRDAQNRDRFRGQVSGWFERLVNHDQVYDHLRLLTNAIADNDGNRDQLQACTGFPAQVVALLAQSPSPSPSPDVCGLALALLMNYGVDNPERMREICAAPHFLEVVLAQAKLNTGQDNWGRIASETLLTFLEVAAESLNLVSYESVDLALDLARLEPDLSNVPAWLLLGQGHLLDSGVRNSQNLQRLVIYCLNNPDDRVCETLSANIAAHKDFRLDPADPLYARCVSAVRAHAAAGCLFVAGVVMDTARKSQALARDPDLTSLCTAACLAKSSSPNSLQAAQVLQWLLDQSWDQCQQFLDARGLELVDALLKVQIAPELALTASALCNIIFRQVPREANDARILSIGPLLLQALAAKDDLSIQNHLVHTLRRVAEYLAHNLERMPDQRPVLVKIVNRLLDQVHKTVTDPGAGSFILSVSKTLGVLSTDRPELFEDEARVRQFLADASNAQGPVLSNCAYISAQLKTHGILPQECDRVLSLMS